VGGTTLGHGALSPCAATPHSGPAIQNRKWDASPMRARMCRARFERIAGRHQSPHDVQIGDRSLVSAGSRPISAPLDRTRRDSTFAGSSSPAHGNAYGPTAVSASESPESKRRIDAMLCGPGDGHARPTRVRGGITFPVFAHSNCCTVCVHLQ